MDWNWISEGLKNEWPVITQAPLASGIAIVVMSSLLGIFMYKLFSEQLKRKNDLIGDLEQKLKFKLQRAFVGSIDDGGFR